MSEKEQLDKMLDNIIKDKGEQAEVHFHDYLQGKMQDVLYGAADEADEAKTDKD